MIGGSPDAMARDFNCNAPSYPAPEVNREPTILQEIERLQTETICMASAALDRVINLQERLVGKVPPADANAIAEGIRFSPEGQLGESYHLAFRLRDTLNRLHRQLDQLTNI
jgi:hypothetical protein